MKKLFRNLMLVAATALGMASCADVPPPFVEPGGGGGSGEGETLPEGVYIDESFASDFGIFDVKTIAGTPWIIDYSCAKATGYDNATSTTTPSKSYLVSKPIDLSASKEAYITFQYILRYATSSGAAKPGVENKVLITNAYTGDPTTTTWTDITGTLTEGSDWNTWSTFNAVVPTDMIGKSTVVVALEYACESNSATWEVKELKMAEGKAEDTPGTPGITDTPIVPEEGNLLVNGNFEGWTSGQPTNWKSACTASSATLEQSTDAHAGSYAVVVKGATANKRLAYKEMTLAAGDYTMSFYAKAVSAEASVRPGYAVVVGGSLSGDSYQYADYVNGITNADWTPVTHSFTLDASTTVCLVVMNPKSTGTDVLIDDFKLTTTNGGTEDGDEEETPGEAKGDGSLENPFNAVAALEYTAALPADQATSEKFYVKGIVCESSKMDISTQYKNATFHISEDGTASTTQFLIFRTKGLNGADITSEDDVQVGDEVIVYASLVNYKGNTPETAQGGMITSLKRNGVELNPGDGGDGGDGTEDGGGDGGDVPAGTNIFENGDFELWADGLPVNWKSASTAGNVTVTQSTESRGGSYAASMGYVASSNKRMAYKETTLPAGTYKFSFYAKGTEAGSKCQTRPGYVAILANGSADSSNYKYGSYATLSTTEWTLVEHEFTLATETTICTVIMSPKDSDYHKSQNILVDDATLVKVK